MLQAKQINVTPPEEGDITYTLRVVFEESTIANAVSLTRLQLRDLAESLAGMGIVPPDAVLRSEYLDLKERYNTLGDSFTKLQTQYLDLTERMRKLAYTEREIEAMRARVTRLTDRLLDCLEDRDAR